MSDLEDIIENAESPEFKAVCQEVADGLWTVINETINGKGNGDEDWEKFYLPAMRHGVLRRLAKECNEGEEGWLTVFCNNVRDHGNA